ncbi:MAG: hypothetical protein KHW79_11080 [Clostridiales bacterium]|nr:hypothetical protein [Clostridiales bacterium]
MPFTAYMLHLFHPKDSLTLIKRREGKNWIHAVLILLFVVIVRVFSVLFSSYLFSSNKDDINLLLEIALMLIPIISFSITCYAVTSILSGEVKFKDLFTAFCFSLIPYVILTIPITALTWILSLESGGLYTGLNIIKWAWVIILGFQSVKQMNDYEFSKTVGVILLSVLAMLLLWITLFLIALFCVQWIQFFQSIFNEFRMLASR